MAKRTNTKAAFLAASLLLAGIVTHLKPAAPAAPKVDGEAAATASGPRRTRVAEPAAAAARQT